MLYEEFLNAIGEIEAFSSKHEQQAPWRVEKHAHLVTTTLANDSDLSFRSLHRDLALE
jgi:hypothetical protein